MNEAFTLSRLLEVVGTMLVAFLSLLAVITVAKRFGVDPSTLKSPDHVFDSGTILTVLAILALPILLVLTVQRPFHGLRIDAALRHRIAFRTFFLGILSGGLIKGLVLLATIAMSTQAEFRSPFPSGMSIAGLLPWWGFFAWYLFLLVLNSLNEELVYRAFPIRNLLSFQERNTYLAYGVVTATALTFSLMHFLLEAPDFGRFLYRFAFGLLTGLVFVQSRNLFSIVGIHTGWNFVALSFSDADWRMGGLIHISGIAKELETYANVWMLFLATLAIALWPIYRQKRRFVCHEEAQ